MKDRWEIVKDAIREIGVLGCIGLAIFYFWKGDSLQGIGWIIAAGVWRKR